MTASGKLKQIGRHGLSGEKVSILAKAAFERTVPTLVDGAIMGETDYMKGMTERVLAGEEIKAGTGIIDIFVNLPSS
jgi:DNA-directed RNA polymerase beta' subunit